MWAGDSGPEEPAGMAAWRERGLGLLADALASADAPFEATVLEPDLELACRNTVRGLPNRGCLRLRAYDDGTLAVFFFRTSLAGGGERFGYGGQAVRLDRLRPVQVRSWLDYVSSGFDHRAAPRGLRREFQFPVPD